jgi:hypothetical protein
MRSIIICTLSDIRLAQPIAQMAEMRNAYRIAVEKSEGTRPLWRFRRR